MIDLGISKLALIGVVALLVVGPEKLPRLARMAGTLLGRAQRYIADVKSQVSREIEMDEIRRLQKDIQGKAQEFEQSVNQEISGIENLDSNSWHDAGDTSTLDDGHSRYAHAADYHDINAYPAKIKNFRRKKLSRISALPVWYKTRHGVHGRVISGAARMSRHRAKSQTPSSFF